MQKRSQSAWSDRGRPRARLGTRAVALVATFALVMSMCPGTAALAFANGRLAGGEAGIQAQGGGDVLSAQDGGETTVDSDTHSMKTGTYHVTGNVTIKPDSTGNGIRVEEGAKVLLIIDEGSTLNVLGKGADGQGAGHAAILLPKGSSLTVAGKGTLNATGGKAGAGAKGGDAGASAAWRDMVSFTGDGGNGGQGGGGAGAGIGTDGGAGGSGGAGGKSVNTDGLTSSNIYGNDGRSGSAGSPAEEAGTVIATGGVTVNATGGSGGPGGSKGKKGHYAEKHYEWGPNTSAGTSGGGGGGAGGSAAYGIGSGGTGGGGGGGGASGNLDGEFSLFVEADLDDLWGHGGAGGAGAWGGGSGEHGDEGASWGDDTGASRKYAKAGGAGGSSSTPKAVPFYTYKNSDSSNPKVTCTSGSKAKRDAIPLGSLSAFKGVGGNAGIVSGGASTYDGKPHGASVGGAGGLKAQSDGSSALGAQAAGDDSGTVTVDGVKVSYAIKYYDEAGKKLKSEPVMPGQYAAVVTFTSKNPDYCGDWVVPVTITKRQVKKPTPKSLTFECADWATGKGALQAAFKAPDGANYEFVEGAKASDGTASKRSARAAGDYMACFRLKDPATCEWADGTEGADAWVPWSIELQEFDPNSKEVTYWGAASNKAKTSVAYTGSPTWVRPWWTPAKAEGGKFPEWFTHWGKKDRPTTKRNSAVVVYLKGKKDREGLVGYHTNKDGSLEKVTAEQVYAWMFGVEVNGKHKSVKSGQKVWYKTDKDGWKVPLKVGGSKPKGAEGYVVARDCAYADKLGVRDAGTYWAYAYFDDGAGFAPTSLAQATVKVKKARNTVTAKGKTVTASAGKARSFKKSKAFKVSKAKGAVTFEKVSGTKKVTVNKKTGKLTVKAGLKAGKTYKVKVKVTAKGNKNYKKASKTVTVKVKVK